VRKGVQELIPEAAADLWNLPERVTLLALAGMGPGTQDIHHRLCRRLVELVLQHAPLRTPWTWVGKVSRLHHAVSSGVLEYNPNGAVVSAAG